MVKKVGWSTITRRVMHTEQEITYSMQHDLCKKPLLTMQFIS